MKKHLILLCTIFLLGTVSVSAQQPSQPKQAHHCPPEIDHEGEVVLSHFAGILGSFINILQAPRDNANVGHNLGNMVHGLANIIATAIKRGEIIHEYVTSQEFAQEVEAFIVTKTQNI